MAEPRHGAQRCVGLILAGGESRRMGRNKALLEWRGRPLLEHMRALLLASGLSEVLISGDFAGYSCVVDQRPGRGPIEALCSVADVIDDCRLLVVPVDMPQLTPELLRILQHPGAVQACRHFSRHPLPMQLSLDANSRSALAVLRETSGRQRSLRALQRALQATVLEIPQGVSGELQSCNTPQQWQQMVGEAR